VELTSPGMICPCFVVRSGLETYTYPITVEREGRKYWAYSEDFPGVDGLGNSIDEAKASILESMRLYIEECRSIIAVNLAKPSFPF
jgi:predicted RNase H-like HicB family nuclease